MDINKLDFKEIKEKLEYVSTIDPSESLDKAFRYLALKRVEVNDIQSVFKILEELGIYFHARYMTTQTIEELYTPYRKFY